jgi:hypothetical protein
MIIMKIIGDKTEPIALMGDFDETVNSAGVT